MRWGRPNRPSVLEGDNAPPESGHDVPCTTLDELQQIVRAGAHPVWSGHPDVVPMVGSGVQLTCTKFSRVYAVGTARVWARGRSTLLAHDDVAVEAFDQSLVAVSGRCRVLGRDWARVRAASSLGVKYLGTSDMRHSDDVRIDLQDAASSDGAPVASTIRATAASSVTIDGVGADVSIELSVSATGQINAGPVGNVRVRANDRSILTAGAGELNLSDAARLHVVQGLGTAPLVTLDLPSEVLIVGDAAAGEGLRHLANGDTVQFLDHAGLRRLPTWLRFSHREPDLWSPPGLLRVYVATSLTPGRDGRPLLGTTPPRTGTFLPGEVIPAGTVVKRVTATPTSSYPGAAYIVALDVLPQDWRPSSLTGAASVHLSQPASVHAVDSLVLQPCDRRD